MLVFLNYKPPSVPLASPSDSAPSAAPASPAPSEKGKEKAPQQANPNNNAKGEVDAFADMGSCVICMDKKREAVSILFLFPFYYLFYDGRHIFHVVTSFAAMIVLS